MVRLEVEPMNSRHASELAHNYFRIADPLVRKRLFYLVRALVGDEGTDTDADADTETDNDDDIRIGDGDSSLRNPFDFGGSGD
jgi:hypothetical protein